jgi:Ca2+-binding RTX toxin-like protein
MRARPALEALESRRLFAAAVDPNNSSHLLVNGTDGDDNILVEISGTILIVTVNNTAQPYSRNGISAILVDAGTGDDTVTVDADLDIPCRIDGGDGDDSLTGAAANDTLIGGSGADTLDAGLGSNSMLSDSLDAIVYARFSNNLVFVEGTENSDTITIQRKAQEARKIVVTVNGSQEEFEFLLSSLAISVQGHGGEDSIVVDSDVNAMSLFDGGEGADSIVGGGADDSILGGSGNDRIFGGGGNDYIDAGLGDDSAHGDDGNDSLLGGAGADDLHGDDGNDTLKGGAQHDTLSGDAGRDMLFPDGVDLLRGDPVDSGVDVSNGVMRIIGSTGDDRILVNFEHKDGSNLMTVIVNGEDVFFPLANVSLIQIDGGSGNDTIEVRNLNVKTALNGGAGNDVLRGSLGPDRLNGGDGNDWLNGAHNKDTLYGDAGNDKLFGGDGKDYLNGGRGADILRGGAGIDRIAATRLIDDIRGNREDLITFAIG